MIFIIYNLEFICSCRTKLVAKEHAICQCHLTFSNHHTYFLFIRKRGAFDIEVRIRNITSTPTVDGDAAASDANPRTRSPNPSLPPRPVARPAVAANPPASPPAINPHHPPTFSHIHSISHPIRRATSVSNSRPYWNYFGFDD